MKINRPALVLALLLTLCFTSLVQAAQIHSNGRGGGDWSDPTAWHGNKVPTAEDDVVISMRDAIAFDLDHSEQITCRNLYLDPEAVLSFKPGRTNRVLTLDGSIESYGIIRIDGTASSRVNVQVRFVSSDKQPRELKMMQYAALFLYGHERTRPGEKNAAMIAAAMSDELPAPMVRVTADDKAMVDVQRSELSNIEFVLRGLDNTNASTTERLNFIDNKFLAGARIDLVACDTPTIRGNEFDPGELTPQHPAIRVYQSSLVEIRNNTIEGKYPYAIFVNSDTDSSCMGNVVRGAIAALYWAGHNAVVKNNLFEDCTTGIVFVGWTGTLEDLRIVRPKTGISVTNATLQLTNIDVSELQEDGAALTLNAASITLLNSSIADDLIKITGGNPPTGVWVESMSYVIVKVEGQIPKNGTVMVQTAAVSGGVPEGKADLNVRSAPGRLSDSGWSPSPASQRAIVVRSWRLVANKTRENAPFYDLMILDAEGKTLKQMRVEPQDTWFRPDPNEAVPTVKVTLP